MKIKKCLLKDYCCVSLFTTLSIVFYYNFFGINNGTLEIAISTALVQSIITIYTMNNIEKTCGNNVYTGGALLLYTTVLYNQIATIKYSVDSFYPGAIDKISTRILGLLYIDIVIIIANLCFRYYHKKKNKGFENDSFKYIKYDKSQITILTIIFLVIYILANVWNLLKTGQLLLVNVSRTIRTFVNILTYITYALTIINIRQNNNNKIVLSSVIPCVVLSIANLFFSLQVGKKSIIVVYMVVVICGLLMTKKIKFSTAKMAAFISPLAINMIQIITELTSDREWFSRSYQLKYHAFRFDISDLAITIASRFGEINKPFNVIKESVLYSIPKVFNENKILELVEYKNQMESVGLIRDFDFNDTFFSMGAQIGGYVGIMVVFILIVIFFESFSYRVLKIKGIGNYINIVLISYFASCESDWSMFIYQTRDALIYILIAFFLFNVGMRIKCRRES